MSRRFARLLRRCHEVFIHAMPDNRRRRLYMFDSFIPDGNEFVLNWRKLFNQYSQLYANLTRKVRTSRPAEHNNNFENTATSATICNTKRQ